MFSFEEDLMRKLLALLFVLALVPVTLFAADNEKEADRVKEAGQVMHEIINIPDDIPKDLFDKAECVIILPSVKKGAIGIGGSYGRGVMTCRSGQHYTGAWTAPAMYALEGLNIGFQLGGQATDFIILVMNPRGAESLMGSKVKLGADASAAAGPKGRSAEGSTDVVMRAEMLSYSRSRGLFAGVSLEGSTLRPDNRANRKLYGRDVSVKEILRQGKVGAPATAHEMLAELTKYSPKNRSDPKSLQ
jgi:SH3 domain-containing YSC84-like protein 1